MCSPNGLVSDICPFLIKTEASYISGAELEKFRLKKSPSKRLEGLSKVLSIYING